MIEIVPYKKSWPEEFQSISAHLRRALGSLAVRIDHVGSTSVPGLAAKDVIDVQVTAATLDGRIKSVMTLIGYLEVEGRVDHRPPDSPEADTQWAKWLFVRPSGQREIHVHVRIQGAANQRYALLFRDYLRVHPASVLAYAELKRRLAQHLADRQTYAVVKDPAVDLIYLAAQAWAKDIGWQPGPSDA